MIRNCRIVSPYLSREFEWIRGNLHSHTVRSDGDLTPAEVVALYEGAGYGFLAISDHDTAPLPPESAPPTGMVLIRGDEVTAKGPHILAIDVPDVIPPEEDRQVVVDAVNRAGGFAILNHPNWQHFDHFPQALMERLQGYLGIEIYNGVIERLEGSALATDRWDQLLSRGRRVWGFANDDFHRMVDFARGWNVVQVAERSAAAICDSLRAGRFYASTGVEIESIAVDGPAISVTAPNAQRIRFLGSWGQEFHYVDGSEARYEVTGAEGDYVRVECYGEGVKAAWTQPLFLIRR